MEATLVHSSAGHLSPGHLSSGHLSSRPIFPSLAQRVSAVCRLVPPAWPLRDLVAVNPYMGCAERDALAAEDLLQRRWGAAALPAWSHLQSAWKAKEFAQEDLLAVLAIPDHPAATPNVATLIAQLENPEHVSPVAPHIRSSVRVAGGNWPAVVHGSLGRFLAARFDQGIARWAPAMSGELFADWQAWVVCDRTLDGAGAPGMRAWLGSLPPNPSTALEQLCAASGVRDEFLDDYLGALLGDLPGWASAIRQQSWHPVADQVGDLPALVAALLAYDVAVQSLLPGKPAPQIPPQEIPANLAADRAARLTALLANEAAWRRHLAQQLRPMDAVAAQARPSVQAVFCIDVRSEPFRRHLETVAPAIETYGFAGFFAMSLAQQHGVHRQEQCPVLLAPAATVALPAPLAKPLSRVLGSVRRSGGGGFAYMESLGLTHAWSLARGALHLHKAPASPAEQAAISYALLGPDQRLALLRGMLKNLGLRPPYARLVLLCGHDSSVINNPQSAGLACGACGGHSGAINARVAVALYNDPGLRALLGADELPADSVAIAGVHDTATDAVRMLDTDRVPASHASDLAALNSACQAAGVGLRRERAPRLPGCPVTSDDAQLTHAIHQRSVDWAEVRPEWALADNGAFIAAPRAMTSSISLNGRCFLHSYDAALDPTGGVLALILTAPVVVASWINLQYYASTIDPQRLGSGSKITHNVVGGIGVVSGGDADLRVGLAWQSVHDGQHAQHRPVRLQVFVAAAQTAIDGVIAGHAHLTDLVRNGWISIHSIEQGSARCARRLPIGGWQDVATGS